MKFHLLMNRLVKKMQPNQSPGDKVKTAYVVGTADTKGEELKYVKEVLKMAGVNAKIIDLGPISQDSSVDVTAAKVATFHPRGADAVHKETDRGQAVTAMSAAQTANEGVLTAPVKLKRLSQLKVQRHKPQVLGRMALLKLPPLGKPVHGACATAVAHGAQCLKQGLDPPALALVAVAVRFEPGDKLLLVRLQHAGCGLPNRVFGLHHLRFAQPLGSRVSRYPKPAAGLAH